MVRIRLRSKRDRPVRYQTSMLCGMVHGRADDFVGVQVEGADLRTHSKTFVEFHEVTADEYYSFHAIAHLVDVVGIDRFSKKFRESHNFVTHVYASKIRGIAYDWKRMTADMVRN